MPIVRIHQAGAIGLNKDLSSHELPDNAWTDGRNVRFLDGMALQFAGHGEVYAGAPITPLHVMPVNVGSERHWLYAGADKIYDVSSAWGTVVHTNLTKQAASVDVDYGVSPNQWTSTSLSGIPILNPGTGAPQQWDLNTANRCTDLSNWPADTSCKALRAYKNQLVALNVSKAGTNYPFMVKWSHPAAPGAVPSSWDEADPTKDAGEADIAEGGDPIIDGLQLGGTFVIYKEQSTWRMDYVGGSFVNSFTKVGGVSGAMNRNCIAEVEIAGAPSHVVLTGSDLVVHNGQTAQSVLGDQLRRSLFGLIDGERFDRCFLFKNPYMNEVFVCFPEGGETIPTLALVWNYAHGTCGLREIPRLHHAAYGPVESGLGQPWDGDASPWFSDVTGWNTSELTPDTARALMASADQKLFLLDSSTTFDGAIPRAFLERRGLSFGAPEGRKLIRGVRPRIRGTEGETVLIKVGSADDPYEDPIYSAPMTYTIGQTVACDCLVDVRYGAIRFESGSAFQWRLDSYDVDVAPAGGW
jgi:hypothetical protein